MHSAFKISMEKILGDRFSIESDQIQSHSHDESWHPPHAPEAVCFPESEQEIMSIVKLCNNYKVPITPYGAGTSIEGQPIPYSSGLSLDTGRMNQILDVFPDDQDCIVQPGVRKDQLNGAVKKYGLFFPAGPQINASIGGMAATSASGINAVRYGTFRDNIRSLKFVSPTGELVQTGGRARKSAAGYDLTNLMVGSEGTLGVITELTLKLTPLPSSIINALVTFDKLEAAIQAVIEVLKSNINPAAIELLDELQIHAINQYSKLDMKRCSSLFIELHGTDMHNFEALRKIEKIMLGKDANTFNHAIDVQEREELWQARKDAYYAALNLEPHKAGFTSDVCVPVSKLAECILECKKDLEHSIIQAPILGHVGDGNFHLVYLIDQNDENQRKELIRLHQKLIRRAIRMGGTCTGEHGIGIGKMDYLKEEKGESYIKMIRSIKKAWDPNYIMNPGKIFVE